MFDVLNLNCILILRYFHEKNGTRQKLVSMGLCEQYVTHEDGFYLVVDCLKVL